MSKRIVPTIVGLTGLTAVILFWRAFLIIVALLCTLVLVAQTAKWWQEWRAVRRFRAAWEPRGKDLLLVYSNSPHWKAYVEERWLPRWGHRRCAELVRTQCLAARSAAGGCTFSCACRGPRVQSARHCRALQRKKGSSRSILAGLSRLQARARRALARCRGRARRLAW